MPVFNGKKLIAGALTGHVAISSGPTDVCKTPAPPAPAPLPVPYPNTKSGVPKSFETLAKQGGSLGKASTEISFRWATGSFAALTALNYHGNFNLFRYKIAGEIHNVFRERGARVQRVLFPDAVRPDGTPIEIKKPKEPESHPGQKANYAKCSPNRKCESIDCVSCDLPCQTWSSECGP